MPIFTIEATYHLPVYRNRTVEAGSIDEACRIAIENDDWSLDDFDFENAGETFVTGAWEGADAACRGACVPIPDHFREAVERKAELFDALLALLKEPAQPMGLSRHDFERWLARATTIIADAETVLQQSARQAE